MFNRITTPLGQQATSFVLAAMVTLSMLGGVNQLAAPGRGATAQQLDGSAEQLVIITASRLSMS
jgi:hypothetical protein